MFPVGAFPQERRPVQHIELNSISLLTQKQNLCVERFFLKHPIKTFQKNSLRKNAMKIKELSFGADDTPYQALMGFQFELGDSNGQKNPEKLLKRQVVRTIF